MDSGRMDRIVVKVSVELPVALFAETNVDQSSSVAALNIVGIEVKDAGSPEIPGDKTSRLLPVENVLPSVPATPDNASTLGLM